MSDLGAPIYFRPRGTPPSMAIGLLCNLGVHNAPQAEQVAAVQAWLNEGHEVTRIMRRTLNSLGLPTTPTT